MAGASPAGSGFRAIVGGILAAVAVLVLLLTYFALPNDHVTAYLVMGTIALVFALIAYLAQALGPAGVRPSVWAWGLAAVGFGFLFGTLGLAPSIPLTSRIVGLILVLLALAVAIGGAAWRSRARSSDAARETARAAWRASAPVNALNYPAAAPPPASPAAAEERHA